MEYNTIKFETPEPGIGFITLNRPERLNAINLDMLEELHALCEQLNSDGDVRVVLITGEGRGFCSGADLLDERISKDAANLFSNSTNEKKSRCQNLTQRGAGCTHLLVPPL